MPVEITMPQLSDTMSEGTVVKWLKKEGDKVKAGEIIAEIETDKATMEQESFESGTLASIVAKEGQKVKVGELIALLAGAGENVEQVKSQGRGAAAAPKKPSAEIGGRMREIAPSRNSSCEIAPRMLVTSRRRLPFANVRTPSSTDKMTWPIGLAIGPSLSASQISPLSSIAVRTSSGVMGLPHLSFS